MKFYFDYYGKRHSVDLYGVEKDYMTVCLDNSKVMRLKTYYRPYKTWDEYMGNSSAGTYVNMPIYKSKKIIYLSDLMR